MAPPIRPDDDPPTTEPPTTEQPTAVGATSLETHDGVRLEAEVHVPANPGAAVVLCHPHPQHGGSMRSLVPSELFRLLPETGVAVLRFNFRGVEGSGGTYGEGIAEQADVEAAVEDLARRVPDRALLVVGWSFGADVSLQVTHPRVHGWVAVAPPLRVVDPSRMSAAGDPRPKLLVVPENDQFAPPDRVRAVTHGWVDTTIEVVAGADHFLVGRTDQVGALVRDRIAALSTG